MTAELLELKKATIDGMFKYMQFGAADDADDPAYDPAFDAGYSQQHIDQCATIVDELFATLARVSEPDRSESIRTAVKVAVLALNQLNDECGSSLIETDQREALCALISAAAAHAGWESSGDLTEEWREW